MKARTLRVQLTIAVVAVLVLVLAAFSLLLYAAFGRALWAALDERLASEARALADMVERLPDGREELEWEGISALPDFDDRRPPAFFQLWRRQGSVLARSPSLRGRDLPRPRSPRVGIGIGAEIEIARGLLPDGRPGRMLLGQLPAHQLGAPATFQVAVARGTEHEDAALAELRHLLWALGALAVLVAAGAAAVTVSRALRPAATLAGAIGLIDEKDLGRRVAVPDLPPELAPAVAKLNEVLGRLDESFARERRFTADVSHELRTPLAGLRTLLEVALTRDRSASEYRAVVGEAAGIVRQMHTLADDLLTLARLDARVEDAPSDGRLPIALRAFVDDCWRPFAARAAERRLVFSNRIDPQATLASDPEKLRVVVRNLLANAAVYTEVGGLVHVQAGQGQSAQGTDVVLDVCDSGPPIPQDLLPRLFERFFRADPSRSGGGAHCGIGLALVEALCVPLGLRASADNLPDGSVRFRLQHARSR